MSLMTSYNDEEPFVLAMVPAIELNSVFDTRYK